MPRRFLSWLAVWGLLFGGTGCAPPSEQPAVRIVREVAWSGRGEWIKADTHIHTKFSDGKHTVSEVAAKAVAHGCDAIAITDHGDRDLRAATQEYADAIEVARRQHPHLTIVAGIEWNVPPWGGDAHATVLLPSGPDEFLLLAEFKERFDDLGRPQHEADLAREALHWLAESIPGPVPPVVLVNHPSRKTQTDSVLVDRLREWRSINEIVAGFSGAPGHQAGDPLGAYRGPVELIDRWDPAVAQIGGAWDRLLQEQTDVWAARAPSDFHSADGPNVVDYWPGQFSETWLYVPERSAAGILQAFRAGSFFAAHGHIVREVQLTVSISGFPRTVRMGEHIEVPPETEIQLGLSGRVPALDWRGQLNRLDEVEFIVVPKAGEPYALPQTVSDTSRFSVTESLSVPAGGLVVRARGRRSVEDGPDLLFYTNPIRISTSAATPPVGNSHALEKSAETSWSIRTILGAGILLLALVSFAVGSYRRSGRFRRFLQVKRAQPTLQKAAAPIPPTVSTESRGPHRGHYLLAAMFFVFIAVYGSLVPLHYRPLSLDEAFERFGNLPYFRPDLGARADWVANILLFIPIGFCFAAAGALDRSGRLVKFLCGALVGLGCIVLSVCLEFTQLWFPPRTVSQNDIMAESLGGGIGVLLWFAVGPALTAWLRSSVGMRNSPSRIDWFLQVYVLGLLIYALMPLDLTLHPVELYRKYREGKIVLLPFANFQFTALELWNRVTDVLIFVPVGVFSARFWWGPTDRRSIRQGMAIGAALVVLVEVAQFFVYSRVSETGDILTGLLGVGCGVILYQRRALFGVRSAFVSPHHHRRNIRRWSIATVAYALVLCFLFWWPFDWNRDPSEIARQLRGFFRAPFAAMYWGTEMNAMTEILRKVLLFAGMAAVVVQLINAYDPSKRVRRLFLKVAFAGCALLGTAIELGQGFFVTHIPDVTDVMLYAIGTGLGLAVTTRIRIDDATSQDEAAPAFPSAPSWKMGMTTAGIGFGLVVVLVAVVVQSGTLWNAKLPAPGAPEQDSANPVRTAEERSGAVFTDRPRDPFAIPEVSRVSIPAFPGADAVWGATGRDRRGGIWFGVSAAEVSVPSAHLFEFNPQTGSITDWGDVVTALEDTGMHRVGESQMKIHTKIIEADDGHLYFASMDETGEKSDGSRLPQWGSHLWRLRRPGNRWEHLRAVPQGLIALSSDGRWISALGYFGHVLFQYDTVTEAFRSVPVGAVGGHVSRNFLTDNRGHVYVPRVTSIATSATKRPSEHLRATLVEYDTNLEIVHETPLARYIDDNRWSFHGITGFTPLADGSIAFTTSVGFLYLLVPGEEGPALIESVGWFHPDGKAYAPSLFTFAGTRYVCGITRRSKRYDWVVYDLELGNSLASRLPLDQTGLNPEKLLLYGSVTRDDDGAFYIGGTSTIRGNEEPVLLRLQIPANP